MPKDKDVNTWTGGALDIIDSFNQDVAQMTHLLNLANARADDTYKQKGAQLFAAGSLSEALAAFTDAWVVNPTCTFYAL